MTIYNRAMVLFSGGMDSLVCLAWALQRYEHVETIGFDYGQRQRVELEIRPDARKAVSEIMGKKLGADHVVDIRSFNQASPSALTRDDISIVSGSGLPSTFTPGRNIIFFTMAAAICYSNNIDTMVAGMCGTDYDGYPDCRPEFMAHMRNTLCMGMDKDFQIRTPLITLRKAEIWNQAYLIGGERLVSAIVLKSHTCYRGDHSTFHDWGYGCDNCPACELRKDGYRAWLKFASNL